MNNNRNAFDYSKEARVKTCLNLFDEAVNARAAVEQNWVIFDNYYNNFHTKSEDIIAAERTLRELYELDDDAINVGGMLTDAYTQIESQVSPNVPEAFFSGRDSVYDSEKAKQREYVVKSILYANNFTSKSTENERIMRKFGDSFAKVYLGHDGNIKVDICEKGSVYPDPSARSLESAEYVDYVYRLHIQELKRLYRKELVKLDVEDRELEGASRCFYSRAEAPENNHSVEVIEHWYKTLDRKIACSIIVANKELKHIDNYWEITGDTNCRFPFVHFYRIKKEGSFWNKSEIEVIMPLIDVIDNTLQSAIKNRSFLGNDTVLIEEGTLVDENNGLDLSPGAVNLVHNGRINGVRRLQGISSIGNAILEVQYYQEQIQKTLRNYDNNNGKETSRITTASGLAQLRADAQEQATNKDFDRLEAFKRLFSLIDWTALEFYREDKLVFLGVPDCTALEKKGDLVENIDANKGNILFTYNSKNMAEIKLGPDGVTAYYPDVDIVIGTSNGGAKNKLYTAQVLENLAAMQITPDNYKIVVRLIEELDIRHKDALIREINAKYKIIEEMQMLELQMQRAQLEAAQQSAGGVELDGEIGRAISGLTPEEQRILKSNPELIDIALGQNRQ